MGRTRHSMGAGCLMLISVAAAEAQESDLFQFFAEEAQVVSASRRPQFIRQAPATVYVVTAEDLKASGAQTLWDALRSIPGVDVMSVRTFYGEVSIRGLNKVLNNRTLVLVDGRSILNGYTDGVNWESIPVLMEEIARIEVVQGPASALYGPNAINGVINIITKTPEELGQGQVSYALGERQTHLGSYLHSGQQQKVGYKVGLGWRSTHRFEDADQLASRTRLANAMLRYSLTEDTWMSLAAGGAKLKTDISYGGLGATSEDGEKGFVRADYHRPNTHMRFSWNKGNSLLAAFQTPQGSPDFTYDTMDFDLERTLALYPRGNLVFGGGVRRSAMEAEFVSPGHINHNLWALFFEHEWHPVRAWTLWTSGRLDRHPHTDLVFSPRFSAIFAPSPHHVLRFSSGTSFRNPTLIENHVDIVADIDVSRLSAPFRILELTMAGSTEVSPERMVLLEVAYNATLGRLKTTASGFHYRLKDVIALSNPVLSAGDSSRVKARISFRNQGGTSAWGEEIGAELLLHRWVNCFANYSYQRLSGTLDAQVAARGMPHHKINGGVRFRRNKLTCNVAIHWVDRTLWNNNPIQFLSSRYLEVAGYSLVDFHLGYRFGGRLRNLEAGLDAFNLLDNEHFETLPRVSTLAPGQAGEIIRARRTLKLTYQF